MTKTVICKVKDGKLDQWKQWCSFLVSKEAEVLETLKYEHVSFESAVLYTIHDTHYVTGTMEFFDEPVAADLNIPLNVEHRKQLSECLELVARGELLYSFRIKD